MYTSYVFEHSSGHLLYSCSCSIRCLIVTRAYENTNLMILAILECSFQHEKLETTNSELRFAHTSHKPLLPPECFLCPFSHFALHSLPPPSHPSLRAQVGYHAFTSLAHQRSHSTSRAQKCPVHNHEHHESVPTRVAQHIPSPYVLAYARFSHRATALGFAYRLPNVSTRARLRSHVRLQISLIEVFPRVFEHFGDFVLNAWGKRQGNV